MSSRYAKHNVVHEALKRLGCVAQAEGYEKELEEAKRSGDGGLLDIAGINRNLVVCSNQINLGEEAATC
jgi:hypothetical protein